MNRPRLENYYEARGFSTQFGANDVTNLQLLCEPCNLKKAAGREPVSKFYQRAIRPGLASK